MWLRSVSELPILEYAGWGAAALLILLAVTGLLVLLVRRGRRSSAARAARALLGADEVASASSCSMSTEQSHVVPALALSPKVPVFAKVLYPVLVVVCCLIYIWADVSVAATVNAKVKAAGAPQGQWEWSGRMASLTLLPAAKDAWNSGARATAVLLGILNGVWPFLQTLVLLNLWHLSLKSHSEACCSTIRTCQGLYGSCRAVACRRRPEAHLTEPSCESLLGRFLRLFAALGKSGGVLEVLCTGPPEAYHFLASSPFGPQFASYTGEGTEPGTQVCA